MQHGLPLQVSSLSGRLKINSSDLTVLQVYEVKGELERHSQPRLLERTAVLREFTE